MKTLEKLAAHDPSLRAALTRLQQLQAIDAALRSPAGLHIASMADAIGVDARTLRRMLACLRSVIGPTEQSVDDEDKYHVTIRYAGRPKRL